MVFEIGKSKSKKRTFMPQLHTHDEHSIKDGCSTVETYADIVQELGGGSLCITNHGQAAGYARQYFACKDRGIKPIFGMEAYVNEHRCKPVREVIAKLREAKKKKKHVDEKLERAQGFLRDRFRPSRHAIILARTREGYRNLIRMSTDSWANGFYYAPRTDIKFLTDHAEGLIYSTACIGGHIPVMARNDFAAAVKEAKRIQKAFDNHFYVELMATEYSKQRETNEVMMRLAKAVNAPMIVTCDVHYAKKKDSLAQDVLLLMRDDKTMKDKEGAGEGIWQFESKDLYWRTLQDVHRCWKKFHSDYWPKDVFLQAIRNTYALADSIEDITFDTSLKLPGIFKHPERDLKAAVLRGFDYRRRNGDLRASGFTKRQYAERIHRELSVISGKGFAEYFLLLQDITDHAREIGARMGPGRGSAGGSLVAYLLRITEIDPMRFGLLFERFLDAGRADPPDIDLDFSPEHRDAVKEYVQGRYPATATIGTFGTFKPRAILKSVGKVFGCDYREMNKVTGPMGTDADGKTWDEIFELWPGVAHWAEENEEAFSVAQTLRGLISYRGKNAAGMLVAPASALDEIPLIRESTGQMVTAFPDSQGTKGVHEGRELSRLGYLKMDILGVRNLNIAPRAVEILTRESGDSVDLASLPLDDEETLAVAATADIPGVFQLDTVVTRPILKHVGADSFSDLVMITALCRPGPLKHKVHRQFRKLKNAGDAWTKEIPEDLVERLEDSRGLMILQEDVMAVVQIMGGFTFEEANACRKIIGKKLDAEKFEPFQIAFIAGGIERGYEEEDLQEVWDKIVTFAGYGFCKSVWYNQLVLIARRVENAKSEDVDLRVRGGDQRTKGVCRPQADLRYRKTGKQVQDGAEEETHDLRMRSGVSKQERVGGPSRVVQTTQGENQTFSFEEPSEDEDKRSERQGFSDQTLSTLRDHRYPESSEKEECTGPSGSLVEEPRRPSHSFRDGKEDVSPTEGQSCPDETTSCLEAPESRTFDSRTCQGDGVSDERNWGVIVDRNFEQEDCGSKTRGNRDKRGMEAIRSVPPQQVGIDRSRRGRPFQKVGKEKSGFSIGGLDSQPNRMGASPGVPDRRDFDQTFGQASYQGIDSEPNSGNGGLRRPPVWTPRTPEATEAQVVKACEVRAGDFVVALDGSWTRVVGVHDHGEQECAEVTFRHAGRVVCTLEHRFPTQVGNRKLKDIGPEHIIPMKRSGLGDRWTDLIGLRLSVGFLPTLDLEIEHPSHCYYLANGICTHNSHAVAYMVTAYQQIYMLAHHPVEYFAALLAETPRAKKTWSGEERLIELMRSAMGRKIVLLRPCVIKSRAEFDVEEGRVRYGLSSIKGVGAGANAVLEARPFASLEELHLKVNRRMCNVAKMKHLILAGAMDDLPFDTDEDEDDLIEYGDGIEVRNGLLARLHQLKKSKKKDEEPDQYTPSVLLGKERELTGLALSWWGSNKKDEIREELGLWTIADVLEDDRSSLPLLVEVSSVRKHKTKAGKTMAFLKLSDESGTLGNVTLWPEHVKRFSDLLKKGKLIVVRLMRRENSREQRRYGKWSYYLDDQTRHPQAEGVAKILRRL